MITEIRQLIDTHINWLRASTNIAQVEEDWYEVTTPYVDRHNDMIQYYVKKDHDGYVLSDGGETIADLAHSGCVLDTPKRHSLLQATLNGFGVKNEKGELITRANRDDFYRKAHGLVQAILAVNDLFYLAVPVVQAVFLEDVVSWLEKQEVRFTENVSFQGKSGFPHHFEIVIPKSRSAPERIVEAINHPTRQSAELFAFRWYDTRETRPTEAMAYALLNNSERPVPSAVLEALRTYEIKPVLWTERENVAAELAA